MNLTYLNGNLTGGKYRLNPPGVSIGREADNDIQLCVNGVSRYHAKISFDGEIWKIEDIGSTNGTLVNGFPVSGPTPLNPGDEISIGEQDLLFGETAETTASAAAKTGRITPLRASASARTVADIPPPPRTEAEEMPKLSIEKAASIFGGASAAGKGVGTPGEEKGKKRGKLGNVIFTLLVVMLALVGIFLFMLLEDIRNRPAPAAAENAEKPPFVLYYEKTVVQHDNVFRFELRVEDGVAAFTLDDLKYGRHFAQKESKIDPKVLEALQDAVRSTEFMKLQEEPPAAPNGETDEKRLLIVSLDSKFNKVAVRNTYAKTSFEHVEEAITRFAEEFDIRISSMTVEEMKTEALNAFRRAEELFANYQAAPENIRGAILRYKLAMNYLDQFEPKPKEWDAARKQLAKAEELYKNLYTGMVFNVKRYFKLRQFDKGSAECQKIMDLVEPDSPEYLNYKRYKLAFDKELRRKK